MDCLLRYRKFISTKINRNWCLNKVNIMLLKKKKYQNDEVKRLIKRLYLTCQIYC